MFSFTSKKLPHNVVENNLYTSATNKQTVEYEQLLEAGKKIPLIILVNIFMGSLTVSLMWGYLSSVFLISWIVLLCVSILARVIILFTYKNAQIETMRRWQNYFIFTSFFSGIIWGFAGLLIEMYVDDIQQGFHAFILGGMAAGSITTSTSIRWNYPAFIYPMLMSLVVYFLLQNDASHYYMATMVLFFILILSIYSFNFRNLQFEKLLALKELNSSKERIKEITASMGEGLFVINDKGGLEFMNPEAEKILGWTFEEIKSFDLDHLVHIHNEDTDEECIVGKIYKDKEKNHFETEFFKRKNGEVFPVSMTVSPIHRNTNLYSGSVVIFEDITERKNMEQKLTRLALHDRLTGLYNRGSFDEKISDELSRSTRYDRQLTLLMLDIDFFKKVNDNYGHQAGDEALKNVADIIKNSIRISDYPARFGGEEFMVILPETQSEKAVDLAERIRKTIESEDIHISETQTIHITISIGVATSVKDISADQLVKKVDEALYKAKNNGRNQVCI